MLTEIPAIHVSGVTELLKLNFSQVQRDCFLAIAAINSNGKMAEMSNVVHVKLPKKISQQYLSDVTKEPVNQEVEKKSDKVLFYVLFSIIAVLMVCILAVVVILKKYRVANGTDSESDVDPLDDLSVIDVTEEVMMVNKDVKNQPFFYRPNTSILKNSFQQNQQNLTAVEEEICNCHELNNDQEDLVINPYINYSYLSNSRPHQSPVKQPKYFHCRQEPIYQNTLEVNYPIYSVVNKTNKSVRIIDPEEEETETEHEDMETETETEPDQEQVRLSPSNAYLELSFEQQCPSGQVRQRRSPLASQKPTSTPQNTDESIYSTPKRITKDSVVSSTPNNKIRTITQV